MKNITIITLLFIAGKIYSQENLYQKIREKIKKEHPEMQVENKLIVVNIWSVNDQASRNANIQINKAHTSYEFARLKGGSKGMVGVLLCTDNDLKSETIILNKDKVAKSVLLTNDGLDLGGVSNIIFDSDGNVINKNMSTDIFEKIHQLITR